MKKLLSILLVAVMVLGSFSAVFAAGSTDGKTITLTGGKSGHTYTLYQIFKGDVVAGADGKNELQNIQWGADAPDAYKGQYDTAAAAAKALVNGDAREWAQDLNLSGKGSKQVELTADGDVVFSGLEEGYYVILDENNNEEAVAGDYSSAIIVEVVDNVNGKLKGSAPSSEKKVYDTNDTEVKFDLSGLTNTDAGWKDSADHDFGDAVPFRLKATTADNVSSYRKYHITFQDTQAQGLTAPTEYTVYAGGQEFTLAANATEAVTKTMTNGTIIKVENATPDEGRTFAVKVTFEPKEGDEYLTADELDSQDIIVRYTSVLNDKAVIGATGNKNEMCIKYSNNPEDKDDKDEGKTPDDTVIVFTYKVVVDKVDEKGADLKGADFTLYKEVAEGTEGAQTGQTIKAGLAEGVEASALKDDALYVVIGHETIDDQVQFSFDRIDDGTYVLVETTIPEGYNAWKSVEVKVEAKHNDDSDVDTETTKPLQLEELKAGDFTTSIEDGKAVQRTKEGSTHTMVSGEAYKEVINKSGAVLPETGGMGTTILYTLGGLLVVGAGVLLVARRKMNDR